MKAILKNGFTNLAISLGLVAAASMVVLVAMVLGAICAFLFGGETWAWSLGLGALDLVLFYFIMRQLQTEIAEGLTGEVGKRTN